MKSNRFNDISANGKYGLGHALRAISKEGDFGLQCLDALINCRRFQEISYDGTDLYSIKNIVLLAEKIGHKCVVDKFKEKLGRTFPLAKKGECVIQ